MKHTLTSTQQGAVLIVTLSILVLLTLIAVTGMRITMTEERMAGNMRERGLAFQSAEMALREAETFINGVAAVTAFNGANGLLGQTDAEPNYYTPGTWTGGNSRVYTGNFDDANLYNARPRYVIKVVGNAGAAGGGGGGPLMGTYGSAGFGSSATVFKITAHGVGMSPNSQVILQEHFGRTF